MCTYIYIYLYCVYTYINHIYIYCVCGRGWGCTRAFQTTSGEWTREAGEWLWFCPGGPHRERERESFCCWQILTCSHKSLTVWWFQHVEKHVSTAILMFEHAKICVSPNNFDPTRGPRSTNFGASQP